MTLGVDLGGTNIRAGIRNGDDIIERAQSPLREKDSFESTMHQLTSLIRGLLTPKIKGIGVAVPSIVDAEKGIVYNVVNIPSWQRVELKSILEGEFGILVQIQNDANCFVLGESRHGVAKGFKNVVGVTLGTGVGSGLILNNEIYSGSGGAGEVGYLNYLDRDFEFYGGSFFFDEIHHTTAQDTYLRAKEGNSEALKIWAEYGVHIGNLVKTVVYAYDPEVIVFGGSIAKAKLFFEDSMKKTMGENFHFTKSMEQLKLLYSENENIILLGASSLVNS